MRSLFNNSLYYWSVASKYVLKKDEKGILYITQDANARSEQYNVFKVAEQIAVDAINIGIMCVNKEDESEIEKAILCFVNRYGLLGIMTDIVYDTDFPKYNRVDLIKNPFIEPLCLPSFEYLDKFLPFDKLDIETLRKEKYLRFVGDFETRIYNSPRNTPITLSIEWERFYAEPYEWVKGVFKSIALMYLKDYYYGDYIPYDWNNLYHYKNDMYDSLPAMYRVEFRDKPYLKWELNSLIAAIQMIIDLIEADDESKLRICKYCHKVYAIPRPNSLYCTTKCKNRYSVYKNRGKIR